MHGGWGWGGGLFNSEKVYSPKTNEYFHFKDRTLSVLSNLSVQLVVYERFFFILVVLYLS